MAAVLSKKLTPARKSEQLSQCAKDMSERKLHSTDIALQCACKYDQEKGGGGLSRRVEIILKKTLKRPQRHTDTHENQPEEITRQRRGRKEKQNKDGQQLKLRAAAICGGRTVTAHSHRISEDLQFLIYLLYYSFFSSYEQSGLVREPGSCLILDHC